MPKKGENIYKRKDGRWEGRYIKSRSEAGKIVYGYVYAKTYREAKEKQKAKIMSCNIQVTNKNPLIFSCIASEWFESIKLHTKTSTQNKYHNMLTNYILPEYGNQPVAAITYDFIEAHCKFLLEAGGKNGKGLSAKTVSDVLAIIRNISKFAIRKGIYVACDAAAIIIWGIILIPKIVDGVYNKISLKNGFYTPLTVEEYEKMIHVSITRVVLIVGIIIFLNLAFYYATKYSAKNYILKNQLLYLAITEPQKLEKSIYDYKLSVFINGTVSNWKNEIEYIKNNGLLIESQESEKMQHLDLTMRMEK